MWKRSNKRAAELFEAAQVKSDAGDDDAALSLYLESLALDSAQPSALYNIGLIHKYRREWRESLRYNSLAAGLRPDDEATNWNLGIAATALREWRAARAAWQRAGMRIEESDAPIVGRFGYSPVRLNGFEESDAAVEVVWAHRLSPVTARLSNIPTPEAGFRYGDVVLHDGAATGTRLYAPGDERPVFNVFELFEASNFITVDARLVVPDAAAMRALASAADAAKIELEDWTANIRALCKACSEGRPHEPHDPAPTDDSWQVGRRVGLASTDPAAVSHLLERWAAGGDGRRIESLAS